MTSVKNPYDTLYNNLKDKFTVVCEGCDCTLGDYMLIKAGKAQTSESNLPATVSSESTTAVTSIVDYVAAHFTVKEAPVRERTIRRFPLRSSISALFTAAAACALVFSFGIFALNNSGVLSPYTANGEVEVVETEIVENEDSTLE